MLNIKTKHILEHFNLDVASSCRKYIRCISPNTRGITFNCPPGNLLKEWEFRWLKTALKSGTKFHEKTHVCHHESSVKCDGQGVVRRLQLENSNIIMADDILRNKVFIVYFRVIHQSIVLIISCSTWQRISHRSDWIDEWNSCKKSSQLIRLDGSIDQLNKIVCLDSSKTQNSSNVQAHPSQRLTKRKVLFSKSPEKQKEPEWTVCVFQAERAPETPIQFIFVHEKGLLHNLNYIDICFKLN